MSDLSPVSANSVRVEMELFSFELEPAIVSIAGEQTATQGHTRGLLNFKFFSAVSVDAL